MPPTAPILFFEKTTPQYFTKLGSKKYPLHLLFAQMLAFWKRRNCSRIIAGVISGFSAASAFASPPIAIADYTSMNMRIDGKLDETEWSRTCAVRLQQKDASNNLPSFDCLVRFLWANEGLYIGVCTTDKTPVFGHTLSGNSLHEEDVFEIFLDVKGDHRQFYEIQINPVRQTFFKCHILTAKPRLTPEGRLTPEFCKSDLWRYEMLEPTGLRAATRFNQKSGLWTIEMFLPAEFLNRRAGGIPLHGGVWRMNLVRHDWDKPLGTPNRHCTYMYWAPVLPGHPHLSPTLMGYIKLKSP